MACVVDPTRPSPSFHEGTFHSIHDCLVPNARLWQHAAALLAAAGGAAAAGIGADGGGEAVVVALLHTPAQARFVELLLAPLPAHTAAIELHPSSRKQCFNLRTPGAVAFDAGPHLVAPQFRREGHWRNASHADRAALAQAAAALRGWAHARAGVPPPPAHARAAAARLRAAQAAADGSATRGSGHVGPPAGARHDERRPPSGGDEAPVLLTIKRHGARRVNNQTEMDESLHECMPWMRHVAYHGNESIAETVRLFASARAVVGPHGAGHSNTYWAAPGTTVVELVLHLSDGHTWRRTDKVVAARGHDITWVAVSHPLVVPPDDSQLVSWWAGYEEGRTRDWGVYHQKSRQFKARVSTCAVAAALRSLLRLSSFFKARSHPTTHPLLTSQTERERVQLCAACALHCRAGRRAGDDLLCAARHPAAVLQPPGGVNDDAGPRQRRGESAGRRRRRRRAAAGAARPCSTSHLPGSVHGCPARTGRVPVVKPAPHLTQFPRLPLCAARSVPAAAATHAGTP